MFMPAGTCYVYYIYGRQNCVNVSSKDEAGAVLIRALEPIEGKEGFVIQVFLISSKNCTTQFLSFSWLLNQYVFVTISYNL